VSIFPPANEQALVGLAAFPTFDLNRQGIIPARPPPLKSILRFKYRQWTLLLNRRLAWRVKSLSNILSEKEWMVATSSCML
jgi:hypothetical protein